MTILNLSTQFIIQYVNKSSTFGSKKTTGFGSRMHDNNNPFASRGLRGMTTYKTIKWLSSLHFTGTIEIPYFKRKVQEVQVHLKILIDIIPTYRNSSWFQGGFDQWSVNKDEGEIEGTCTPLLSAIKPCVHLLGIARQITAWSQILSVIK